MNHRLAGALAALVCVLALGSAYFAQYVLLLTPCELCLWERWPYRVALLLALLAIMVRHASARVLFGLASAVMFANVLIAGLHVGVEWNWWNSPLPECNGALTPGAPLPMFPATPCDRAVYLISHVHISMAMMDFIASLVFALALAAYASRKPRRFR
jgi:disulfide bond formation protein DsbB